MAEQTPSGGEANAAAFSYLLVPFWLLLFLLGGWGYLVTGTGGQDTSVFGPMVDVYAWITPWSYDSGVRWLPSILYGAFVAVTLGFCGLLWIGGPPFLKAHAARALLFYVLALPTVLALPYVTGVVAWLPEGGFSVMQGDQVVATPMGIVARRASAFAFPGLLMAVPSVFKWQEGLRDGVRGRPPSPLGRRFWIAVVVFAVLSVLIVAGGIFKPL